ncbi:MAG: hypothetical protein V7609_3044 [Verrucomicrobiota bacterium]
MKLSDARQAYYDYSARLSDISRQLNLAGIAVIWIFKTTTVAGIPFSVFLLWPLAFHVLGLAFDVLQYAYASAAWGIFHRRREKSGIKEDEHFGAPSAINIPTNIFFWGKTVATVVAYTLALFYISTQLVGNI